MAFLTPKDTRQIQNFFVTWLNSNLDDPYEQATSKTRTTLVYGDDFRLTKVLPIIHFDCADFVPNKIAVQSKTNYMEHEEHHFMIYYYNQKVHRYTFSDNGLTLEGEAQCRKYLEYIRDTIKANATAFSGYCHDITFGTIPKPVYNSDTQLFMSMLPVTVFTFRR